MPYLKVATLVEYDWGQLTDHVGAPGASEFVLVVLSESLGAVELHGADEAPRLARESPFLCAVVAAREGVAEGGRTNHRGEL